MCISTILVIFNSLPSMDKMLFYICVLCGCVHVCVCVSKVKPQYITSTIESHHHLVPMKVSENEFLTKLFLLSAALDTTSQIAVN